MTTERPGVHSARAAPQPKPDPQEPVTIERLERGLALLAYFIERDGSVCVPLFEKLERELETMRSREDTVSRAKRLLENMASPMPCRLLDAPRPDGRL